MVELGKMGSGVGTGSSGGREDCSRDVLCEKRITFKKCGSLLITQINHTDCYEDV